MSDFIACELGEPIEVDFRDGGLNATVVPERPLSPTLLALMGHVPPEVQRAITEANNSGLPFCPQHETNAPTASVVPIADKFEL